MKKDKVVMDILNDSRLLSFFNHLKTSNWRKLRENNKKNFFIRGSKLVGEAIGIDPVLVEVIDAQLKNNFIDEDMYKNTFVEEDGTLIINDISYNQYLTLYEYFYRLRMHLLELDYLGKYDLNLSEDKKKELNYNYRLIDFGDSFVKMAFDEGDLYEDYQFINKEAREFASVLLFEIIKRNYDINDGYDEEFFMSDSKIMDSELLNEKGQFYIDRHNGDKSQSMHRLQSIKDKIEVMSNDDLSSVEDKNLYFIVYPFIIKNAKSENIINGFNEIIKRIYSDDIKIICDKRGLVINDNIYSKKDINNLLNIVLYECLNDMDKYLREDTSLLDQYLLESKGLEDAILSYKKQWLFSVILKIDSSNNPRDFGDFKYQSIFR